MKFKSYVVDPNCWFTSDLHLNHSNIIKFCNRPFISVEEMNKTIIDNWNSVINKNDTVFLLGDVVFGGYDIWNYFMERLNGLKILIAGNHDKSITINKFHRVDQILNIIVNDPEIKGGQRITLCHYPMYSWYQSHRGAWQLYGHLHNGKVEISNDVKDEEVIKEVESYVKSELALISRLRNVQYDVGVDGNDFTPVSYYNLKQIINSKK